MAYKTKRMDIKNAPDEDAANALISANEGWELEGDWDKKTELLETMFSIKNISMHNIGPNGHSDEIPDRKWVEFWSLLECVMNFPYL